MYNILSMPKINKSVLMSGAEFFNDNDAINVLMDDSIPVDVSQAIAEHSRIKEAFIQAGIIVKQVAAPPDCQDAVYTANWGLSRNGKVLMSRLPNKRSPEEAYAITAVKELGLEPLLLPDNVERFSGQGDALPCGDIVFTQSPFRTTKEAHPYIKDMLGYKEVIALETKPTRWLGFGPAKNNRVTGWPDSPTYDLDLALAVLRWPEEGQKGLIAYCPDVFKKSSQNILDNYDGVDKIKVSKEEAMDAFALNMVSTGETVIMSNGAPVYEAALKAKGFRTITLDLPELRKGGGSIRCSSLTLDN
jgi:N-dimethylarginine dimethylaminohydrolase